MKNIFITATDTGVGKTIVSLLIMNYLYKNYNRPVYLKIFQTGCSSIFDADSDAYFVYKNILPEVKKEFLKDKICYLFKNPKAPYFAARDENCEIDISYVFNWIEEKISIYHPVVLEGAGGLFVPITKNFLMIDLIEELDVHVILVARPYLGTINHTLLSLEALYSRDIPVKCVVFSNQSREDVPLDMVQENIEAVEFFGKVPTFFVDYIGNPTGDKENYLNLIEKLLS